MLSFFQSLKVFAVVFYVVCVPFMTFVNPSFLNIESGSMLPIISISKSAFCCACNALLT
eukprot:m.364029 g.364029  ORF g.364029 m.364029 type:complete len:59 (-) comp25077_c0_seq1:172-348(-)